jgi:MFS transporter, PPP family, 3-phenylpropionic acid transporter
MPRAEPTPATAPRGGPGGLYSRLSIFYLCYFGAIGVFVPFFSLHLQREGFGAVAIGQLMAIPMAMRVLAPGLWGWAADHSGRRDLTLRVGVLLAAGGAALLLGASGFIAVALALAAFALPWSGLLPQFEATTLSHLGDQPQRYGLVRLWGSVGFILAVIGGGLVFEGRIASRRCRWCCCCSSPPTAVAVWRAPRVRRQNAGRQGPQQLWRRPATPVGCGAARRLCAATGCFRHLLRVFHHLSRPAGLRHGGGWPAVGLGRGCRSGDVSLYSATDREVMVRAHCLSFRARRFSRCAGCLPPGRRASLPLLLFAQTLHMAAFGLFHAVAVLLIHRGFGGRLQGRGQALYSALGFGVGGALGSLGSGYAWAVAGPAGRMDRGGCGGRGRNGWWPGGAWRRAAAWTGMPAPGSRIDRVRAQHAGRGMSDTATGFQ